MLVVRLLGGDDRGLARLAGRVSLVLVRLDDRSALVGVRDLLALAFL